MVSRVAVAIPRDLSPSGARARLHQYPGVFFVSGRNAGSYMRAMDKGAKGWLYLTAKKNYWRVAAWYEFEDLIHDGIMHYYRIVDRYETRPGRVRSTRHIMSLFKITYVNHLHDLSKKYPKNIFKVEVPIDDLTPEVFAQLSYHPPQELIAFAPPLVKLTLTVLMTTAGARKLRMADRMRNRFTFNEKLCRILGLDPRIVDLPNEVYRYLKGGDYVSSTYSVNGIQ